MSPKGYKEVYLDYHGHPQAITLEAYEQISAIITANLICMYCCNGYTDANPQIAENVCLACFLKHRDTPPRDLSFLGAVPSEYAERYGYKIFKFVDAQGYVYLINSHQKLNDSLAQDIHATLVHYGFTVPERYTLKQGEAVALSAHAWSRIYGDFKTSPVILATYHETYDNHLATAFLLYRDRDPLELSKRKNPTRHWYLASKAAIEATYQPHQGYIVGTGADGEDRTAYQLYDYHLYPGIVALAQQEYTQTHTENASTLS